MSVLRVVSISGGKDSEACAALAHLLHSNDEIRLVFADTGNEHEATYDFVYGYLGQALGLTVETVRANFDERIANKRKFIETKWPGMGISAGKVERALAILRPTGNPYLDLCMWKGRFPSRMAQFCTSELKTEPLVDYQLDLIDRGFFVESWQGVRRDESQKRKNALEREVVGGGLSIYRPIVAWTAEKTVQFVRDYGLKLNPLYTLGMNRVGCMPCINASKGEIAEIARRFPAEIERIAEWEAIVKDAAKRDLATFFPDVGTDTPGSRTVWEVVKWAKTHRGGKKHNSEWDAPAPACSSAYGLCE